MAMPSRWTFQAVLEGDIAATREVREAIEGKAAIRVTEEQESRHVPVRTN
jgi:hypothetical protein